MDTAIEDSKEIHAPWKVWKQRRYVVAVLAFFGFFNTFALRSNLSIAVVAMTENKTVVLEDGNLTHIQEFDWDSEMQGYILSSSFYGYITTQLFGGWLATKIGGKRVFGIGIALVAAVTLVTPIAAKQSFYLLIAVRILEGMAEGVTFPCMHAVLSQWAPPLERSRLTTIAFSGCYVGTVVAMPVCAYLSNTLGWESIFYVFGAIGLIWFCCWWFIVAETPSQDSKITMMELNYITESLGDMNCSGHVVKHPWGRILTSVPVWAIFVAHFCENWAMYTFLTLLPKFMKEILQFELGKIGIMSAIPYLAMAITVQFAGYFADLFQMKKICTTTQVRKFFTCGAFLAHAICMLGAAYSSSPTGKVICITMAVCVGGFAVAGFCVNYLDIGPRHASILMGFGNTFATLPGILSPIITGYVVKTPNESEWQIVFYISSVVHIIGCVFYASCASGEVQPWATEAQNPKSKNQDLRNVAHENFTYISD